ncbi:hypothetical protein DSO57_1009180 [Entomophthora muscae]|uniref:Uncharacterized protein n=1 Tax=Entomophthora muscae TaxID=34485 RepID=A0ACC2T7S0_9FUNG|nr:hypothetical protein DSO57_1009180 [Entomophthora muscae]
MLVKSSKEDAEVTDAIFKNVLVLLPLQNVYNEFPVLRCMIEKWDKELAEAHDILDVLPPFGCTTVKIDNSSPLETQVQEQDSNPGPGSLQAARPMDCPPMFFRDQAPASQGFCEFPKPEY